MLQDSLRSAVYRSLTKPLADGCEATDTCTTNARSRASKSCGPMCLQHTQAKGHQRESEEGTSTMRRRDTREAQLSRVSRGARELTRMIDSLSKSPNLNGQSRHFARDLLRGSLDLEESLAMLSEIQQGSRMFGLQEPRFSVDGRYTKRSEFVGKFGYQEARHSVEGSSRSSAEQMQRVSASTFRLKHRYGGDEKSRYSFGGSSKELERMCQVKFKQSSGLTKEEIGVGETSKYEKFGLQDPRFSVGGSSRESIGELSRVIKESLLQQNLLSRSPEDETTGSPTLQQTKAKSPNLIAKLMGLEEVPAQEVEPVEYKDKKKPSNVSRPAIDIDRPKAKKLQLVGEKKKAKPKQKPLQEIIEAMQFKGLLKGTQFDVPRIIPHPFYEMRWENFSRSFDRDEESPPIVIMKPLYLPQWKRAEVQKTLLPDKFSGNLIKEENVSDQGPSFSRSLERGEVKSTEKAEIADFSIVSQKLQREEAFKARKKADERQKPLLDVNMDAERKHGRAKRVPISQTKTTPSAPAKSDKRLSRTKSKVFPVKPEPKNSANFVKEKKSPTAKSDAKSTNIKPNEKNHKDGKETIIVHEMDTSTKGASLPAEKTPQATEKEAKTCNKAIARENQEPSVAVMPKTSQAMKVHEITKEVVAVDDDLMCLLLSSRSFITQARELFGTNAHQRTHHSIKEIEEDVMKNAKLYLDCSKEIMERKRHQNEHLLHPMLQAQMWDRTASFTLHQLAEEVRSKIRILTSYIKVDRCNNTSDDRLEGDIRCKDMLVNAMWDIGWIARGYPEETGEVVCEVEESILSLLVSEVATELVC